VRTNARAHTGAGGCRHTAVVGAVDRRAGGEGLEQLLVAAGVVPVVVCGVDSLDGHALLLSGLEHLLRLHRVDGGRHLVSLVNEQIGYARS
jgi:hypothetical protein